MVWMMQKIELLASLKSEISNEEFEQIRSGEMPHLGASNRDLILKMMEDTRVSDEWIDDAIVERLRNITYEYLAEQLTGYPEVWKWIFICCAYTTYILGEPMHSREWVHYTTKQVNGKTEYYCPMKSSKPDTNCSFCVCRYLEEMN